MFGLNTDPTADASYCSIDYAWYVTGGTNGYIYESCGNVATGITLAAGDVLAISYDGINVKYLQNGVVRRTVAATITSPLYFDSSYSNAGATQTFSRIQIGGMSSVGDFVKKAGDTMTGTLSFSQPVGLGFVNGQYIKDNSNGGLVIYSGAALNLNSTSLTANGNTIWHAGNDGAGSGLYSDMLESGSTSDLNAVWTAESSSIANGLQIYRYNADATNRPVTINNANWVMNLYSHPGTGSYGHQIAGADSQDLYFRTVSNGGFTGWSKLWHSDNDGHTAGGTGVDADLLDGQHATAFMTTGTDNWVNTTGDTMTGALTINKGHAVNVADYDLELYADYGTENKELSIRFHQGSRWWSQIRNNGTGFRFTTGESGTYVPVMQLFMLGI
jgi:hypothetical protein